jgi:rhodanese-related sulfurtransferase
MAQSEDAPAMLRPCSRRARSGLRRLSPAKANAAIAREVRSSQRARVETRSELSPPRLRGRPPRRPVIVICNEGYQSSLEAATLKRFGLDVTDDIGGFQAWRAAGLPFSR